MCNRTLQEGLVMEYGSIEREIHVEAAPEIVYEVISSPAHMREWWPDEAHFEPVPGGTGDITFIDKAGAGRTTVPFTVVATEPPRFFSFRWTHPADESANQGNSLLVTFELTPVGEGTRVRFTETGFRERGWEIAALEEQYNEHVKGWDYFIPRLNEYVERLVSSR
ncbi:SRPBCC family protein [Kribbella deserti]|uniref:SRPBCC family protein n=1 Tax=Kribbella deserti TaxID=1926257 RepID=A0ABV6QMD2_9ACTN